MIAALLKNRLCGAKEVESTGATCKEQKLTMRACLLQAAFTWLLVELLHPFFHLFSSAVQLNLHEGDLHVCLCISLVLPVFY